MTSVLYHDYYYPPNSINTLFSERASIEHLCLCSITCTSFKQQGHIGIRLFAILPMKRGYTESPSTSLGPPHSRFRHNPEGEFHWNLPLSFILLKFLDDYLLDFWILGHGFCGLGVALGLVAGKVEENKGAWNLSPWVRIFFRVSRAICWWLG